MVTDGAQSSTVRRAAKLFSARAFRPVLRGQVSAELNESIAALRADLDLDASASNGDVVDGAYLLLARSYRPEYVYKNLIATKLFIGRHRASNSVLLNEFRVGGAVADAVLVNGQATVYEIKTELDNPDKLERQLAEYYTAFPRVYVVVHESVATRYLGLLEGSCAGVISVGTRWRLSTVKSAQASYGELRVQTMFNALRLEETRFALRTLGFSVPEVPNGLRYEAYLAAASRASAVEFHEVFRAALKRRNLNRDTALYLDPALLPLRSLLIQLDPSPAEGENLRAWLSRKG